MLKKNKTKQNKNVNIFRSQIYSKRQRDEISIRKRNV